MRTRDEAPKYTSPIQAKKIERRYAVQLRKIARHVGEIIDGLAPRGITTADSTVAITSALARYAALIEPWAESVGRRMLADINRQDAKVWQSRSKAIGRGLRRTVDDTPVGAVLRQRLADQVDLITSLPTEAAQRVHKLATEAVADGKRASQLAAEIMRSGEVTASRATVIAKTEISRTATLLTQTRAEAVGSVEYEWITAHDGDVRASHKAMAGRVFRWDSPPKVDGMVGHPGMFPNCRCIPRPLFRD